MSDADRPMSPTGPVRPTGTARRLLLVVGLVVALESLAIFALAALDLADLDGARLGLGLGAALLLGVYALGMLWAVSRVINGHSWGRGFLVLTQLIQVLIAYNTRDYAWWVPTLLAGTGIVALVCLLSPPVTAALVDDPEAF